MKSLAFKASLILAGAAWLAGCSSDPNTRKLKLLADGDKFYKSAKYQEAVIEYRNALEIDPRFAAAHYQLAKTYLALKKSAPAFHELNEAVTLDPSNAQAHLDLATLLLDRLQLTQAQVLLQKVLAADPENARAHALLGEEHTLNHDFPKAIQEFQKAIELDPDRIQSYAALGAAYRAAGQLADAEGAYRKALKRSPKSSPARAELGQYLFSVGKLAEAEDEMRAACDLDTQALTPRIFLARIYMAMGRMADAEATYASLKRIAPENPEVYEALGRFYVSTGQKLKAVDEFQSLAKAKPRDLSVKNHLAESLLDLNRTAEATPLAGEILRANPSDPQGLLTQGRIFLATGAYEKAIETLQKAVKAAPESANAYYLLGIAQQSARFPDVAKASFNRALELQPRMASAAGALANLDAITGDYSDAFRQADNARRVDPSLFSANLAQVRALIAKGDLHQAEVAIEDLLKRDPTSPASLSLLVNLYSREGRARDAVPRLAGLIQQHPQSAGLHFLLGLAYFSINNLPQSGDSVRTALRLDPKTPDAYTLLANIALARGQADEAKSDLRSAIAASPRNLLNYMTLVTQYEKEGNWHGATELCERAHEIDPNAPMVAAELAFLYLEHGGNVNSAVALAQVAKQKMPESPVTADALGWAYYKLGSFDSALVQLKESAQKVPNNPIYHYHLGMAYMAARQFNPARQSLRAALQADPHFPYAADARTALEKIPAVVQ